MAHAAVIVAILIAEAFVIRLFGPAPGMLIPLVGIALNLLFVVMKVGRTGAFTTWGLAKHQSTQEERLLQLYGLSLVGGASWSFGRFMANS